MAMTCTSVGAGVGVGEGAGVGVGVGASIDARVGAGVGALPSSRIYSRRMLALVFEFIFPISWGDSRGTITGDLYSSPIVVGGVPRHPHSSRCACLQPRPPRSCCSPRRPRDLPQLAPPTTGLPAAAAAAPSQSFEKRSWTLCHHKYSLSRLLRQINLSISR